MPKLTVTIRSKELLLILAKRNMSQNGLARGAQLQGGHVSQLINGKRNVSPATRQKLLNALPGVQFDDIFAIDESE
jgi:transcriptional regulator with XRE-family HTH domain